MRFIYLLKNIINGKVYVGQTKNPEARKRGHFSCARKNIKRPLYYAINKHGKENFEFTILESCDDMLVDEREEYWQTHYKSCESEFGYNLVKGGKQFFSFTKETLEKISGKNHHMFGKMGRQNPFYGQKHSDETRKMMSEKSKKWNCSEQGKKFNSERMTGEKNHMYNKTGSKNPNSKLTNENLVEIKKMLLTHKDKEIAVNFNVSRITIMRIRNGTSSYCKEMK